MSDKYLPNIGGIPNENAQRDAIHIAVAPMIAGERLYACNCVKLSSVDNGVVIGADNDDPDCIGVVDPFFAAGDGWNKVGVNKGSRVWVFLKPNTISYLRHHWEHPAFTEVERRSKTLTDNEKWLRTFCKQNAMNFEELMRALQNGEDRYAASRDLDFSSTELAEFWRRVSEYMGVDQYTRENFQFSCSC